MTGEEREKLQRWIDAYLDGRLSEEQLEKFQRFLEKNPAVRSELELQSEIDESLGRLFAAPDDQADRAKRLLEGSPKAAKKPRRSKGWRSPPAIIAAVLVLAVFGGGGWWVWKSLNPEIQEFQPRNPKLTLAQAYHQFAGKDFEPDWACETDKEFACTFDYRLGKGMALAESPPGVEVFGLAYANIITRNTILLTGKAEGEGIIVFVDRASSDRGQTVDPASGLKLHKRKLDHLMLYEVSKLDKPYMLDLLKEKQVPEEWRKDFRPRSLGG